MGECTKCGAALNDDNKCSCNPDVCCNCCECPEDCTCGCRDK